MVGHLSGDKLIVVLFIAYVIFAVSLFTADHVQSASQASSQTRINVTVTATVAITASKSITDGVTFGSLAVNTNNNNGTGNRNGLNANTTYNISIDGTTDVNINLTQRLNASLNTSTTILVVGGGNLTSKHNATNGNQSVIVPGFDEVNMSNSSFTDLSVGKAGDCVNLAANRVCHIAFWLDVPANIITGDYHASYCFCAYQDNDANAKTSCTCSAA